uniref:Uncharacterized protein n=2 Tax=Rhodnius prolixus TaxID=13249 RepID=T1HUK9_RHOPR
MPTRAVAQSLPSQPVFPAQNLLGVPFMLPTNKFPVTTPFLPEDPAISNKCKEDKGSGTSSVVLMPPPSVVPVSVRRSSQSIILPESIDLKRETETPPTEPVQVTVTPDLTESCQPSMATLREFVSTPNTPLPALSVETYFSKIEAKPLNANPSSGVSQPSLLVQKQERNDEGIVRDLLRSQALQEEITASMIAQTNVHETAKLDAFVNSTVEGHIESARRSSSENEVPIQQVPMQTSPLNLNAHESISLTSPVTIEHILPLQQQIASPLQQQITSPLQPQIPSPLQQQITSPLQQMASPIMTNGIVTDSILTPTTFSPGKDIRTVSDTISMAPVATTAFTDINTSTAPSSTEMIMKAVNDAQFSPAQELVITSTIKDVLTSQGPPPLQTGTVLRPEEFISPGRQISQTDQMLEKAEPARYQPGIIINPVFSITDQTLSSGENKSKVPVSPETSFQSTLVLENNHFTPPGEAAENLAARINTGYTQNIVFQPNRDLSVTNNQTNVTTFAADVVADVKNQFTNPTFPTTTENTNIINGKINDTFSTSPKSEQVQENATIVTLASTSQFINTVAANGELKTTAEVTQVQENKQYGPEVPRCTSEIQKQVAPQVDELARMSEHDLLSYINPSCFDQVL